MTDQKTILAEADSIVNGQRRADYGGPFESFSDIAKGWSMVLGTEVTPEQVGLCMIQLKVARAKNGGFHRDSFVDIAGYAQCMEFIAEARDARAAEEAERAKARDVSPTRWRHPSGRVCQPDGSPGRITDWRIVVDEDGFARDMGEDAPTKSWCTMGHGGHEMKAV